jgi:hypothetical protein
MRLNRSRTAYTLHGCVETCQHGDLGVLRARRESLVGQGDESTVVVLERKLVTHDTEDVDTNITSLSSGESGP